MPERTSKIDDEEVAMKTPIEIFKSEDGKVQVNGIIENETAWLTQSAMAELFGVQKAAISKHLKNIFEAGELQEKVVVSKMETTTRHGAIEGKTQGHLVNFYSLDAIIAVGYRVNSARATQFRIWATKVLKEYIIKGFALNDERIRSPRKPPRCGWRSSRAVCAKRSVARVLRSLNAICGIWKMTTMTGKAVNDGNQDNKG